MAEDIASNVVGTMLEPIRDSLYAFISRQFGYLVHCKKNIKEFEKELKNLNDKMKSVQTSVDAAKNNAEEIEDKVTEWLTQVETSLPTMEREKERLLLDAQNLKCLHLCSRYGLGRDAKKKTTVVTNLIKDGNFGPSVGHRPPLTGIWHRTDTINYESFQSRESVFKEIMETLKDDRHYKIGIHGMPGVGKTRMMEEVAKGGHFDEIVKIVVTQNPNLKDIQLKLAESLNLTLDKETEDARKGLLRNRLKNGKKILLMVDDIWNNEIKLEDIGIPFVGDHTYGCKIILTSRIRDVCIRMGVQKNFEIGVLSELEAWDLFKKTVGDSTERPELHSIAKQVCSECDRLPLAIVTIGAALQNEKGRSAWVHALQQLQDSKGYNITGVTKKLYSCIELSYQYLKQKDPKQKDLQPCFLYCCLFPEDAEISIDNLVTYGVATRFLEGTNRASMEIARNRTRQLVDTLKKSNLLLNGNDENFVKMHDVIRDVAISIASEEKDAMFLVKAGVDKWPDEDEYKHCKAISLRFRDDCVLPDDLECTQVCTLMLEFRKLSSEVPSTFFKWMEKLQVLHLREMLITTLPSSLKNLRMLHLYHCKLVNVAFLGELRKLEILIIEDQDLKELAPEIGQLTRLRLLDLRKCEGLKILPSRVISSLSQLEELYIPDEFDQWKVKDNASLNELNSLKRLISLQVHVPNVELLPLNELLFKSLIRFQISIGSKFYFWEENCSRTLTLVGFPLKKRERELKILMEKAQVLYLIQLKGLKDVFDDRYGEEGFQELEYLEVEDCDDEMEDLLGKPKWINSQSNQLCASGGSFSKLRELKVTYCRLMKYLFSAATRGLPQLQRLCINDCEMLEEIVGDIEQEEIVGDTIITFHQLKIMELWNLPNLRSFYGNTKKKMSTRGCNTSTLAQALFNHKVAFPALEKLEIKGLGSLTAIWNDPLQSVLLRLQELTIRDCEMLEEIISDDQEVMMNTVSFHQLKEINLYGLPNLRSFYVNLKKTSTTRCNTSTLMQALFNHKIRFPALEELNIYDLKSLTAIWDNELFSSSKGEDSFHRLRSITVEKCHKLNHIWITDSGGLLMFHNLTSLTVKKCNSLRYLFSLSIARRLTQLRELEIRSCDAMEEIVVKNEEQGEEEDSTNEIVFPKLWNLEDEEQGEEEDSTNEIVFPKLWNLELESLPKLTSFCGANNAAFKFPSLQIVGLQKCPELQTFASGGISTPPNIYVKGEGNYYCEASELNKYVEQQYDGKGKGVQTVDNEDEGTSS